MGGKRIEQGDRFGKLEAVEMKHKKSASGRLRTHWLCVCDCSGDALVDSGNLRNGNTTQCKSCADIARGAARVTHGQTSGGRSKIYNTWSHIIQRITNPKNKRFADYGGRGLDMSPEWRDSFEAFARDMGEPPTPDHQIEREDNDCGYWPDNCRWADRYEQGANKRNNIVITWRGQTKTLAEWCRETGIAFDTAKMRHNRHPYNGDRIFAKGRLRTGKVLTVDGVRFDTIEQAAKAYGLSTSGATGRFGSKSFPNWEAKERKRHEHQRTACFAGNV